MSIQLIKEKNLLTAQIKTIFLPDQQTALEQLLANVKYKIRSLRKSEKSRKRRWLVKNVPLADLEDLPDKPPLQKSFPTNCFCFEQFFQILSTRRNASAPGLNVIPYKVYKKCP